MIEKAVGDVRAFTPLAANEVAVFRAARGQFVELLGQARLFGQQCGVVGCRRNGLAGLIEQGLQGVGVRSETLLFERLAADPVLANPAQAKFNPAILKQLLGLFPEPGKEAAALPTREPAEPKAAKSVKKA